MTIACPISGIALSSVVMTEKPASIDEKRDEEAFNALLGKMMSTPPKPHDQMKKGREPKPAPKAD